MKNGVDRKRRGKEGTSVEKGEKEIARLGDSCVRT